MERERRALLKLAGLTVVGLAAGRSAAPWRRPRRTRVKPGTKRLAMVIDPRKCLEQDGCTDCIGACHAVHNVPSIDDPRHEVKWIWKEKFSGAFPDQEAEYVDEALTGKPVLVFCNHCDNPPCVRVCPTQAPGGATTGS